MEETKVIYHVDDQETPYLVKILGAPLTLKDFRDAVLQGPESVLSYKFFFKSKDDDFGVVKEEIFHDDAKLPLFNGRVVAWLVSSGAHDGGRRAPSIVSSSSDRESSILPPEGLERGPGVGETRPSSFRRVKKGMEERLDLESMSLSRNETTDVYNDTESSITSVSQVAQNHRRHELEQRMRRGYNYSGGRGAESSSVLSSEIESSVYDTEDASSVVSSRFTTSTEHTSVSRNAYRQRQKKKSRKKALHMERSGSISSVTESTLSLNIMTVTLNMDTVNFLGISIVGQSNKQGDGDCGIYVGSIMKGGAVALDGRIDPGDMILQVNEINFENMSNDDAVRVLREVVQKPGPIKLIIAKCWDSSPKGYLTIPRTEPIRPIDPGAWVAHTAAVREYQCRAPSVTTMSASSVQSSHPDTEKFVPIVSQPLVTDSGMNVIVKAMALPNSGLEVRDRLWLKINICNAFIGSDVVDWLFSNVSGFSDRREAKKYATQMLKNNFIKHAVNKASFSEQCYYVFGSALKDASSSSYGTSTLKLSDGRVSEGTITPTPPVMGGVWTGAPPPTDPPPPLPNAPPWMSNDSSMSYHVYPPIYNPAPPPSANYAHLPCESETSYTIFQQPHSVSSSGSSHPSQPHLILAPSGSESESDNPSDLGHSLKHDQRLIVNSAPLNKNIGVK